MVPEGECGGHFLDWRSVRATGRRRTRICVIAVAVGLGCVACSSGSSATRQSADAPRTSTSPTSSADSASSGAPASSAPPATTSTRPGTTSHGPSAAQVRTAKRIHGLAGARGRSGYSVAVRDTTTGATFSTGATSGMYEGSIAKVDIAETLMLQHQQRHTTLSSSDRRLLTAMIEHSDNDAANTLWTREGGRTAVAKANTELGLRHTTLGTGIYWGFSRTNAGDQLALLQALVQRDGPLTAKSQAYVRGLMRNVESDQRWGVATLADDPDDTSLKNGWLASSLDDNRWLVNSLGIVHRHGHTYLMAVLTQHGSSFAGGIDLVQDIAHAALAGV